MYVYNMGHLNLILILNLLYDVRLFCLWNRNDAFCLSFSDLNHFFRSKKKV